MIRLRQAAVGIMLIAIPAAAFAMDADTFYLKAAALNKKGMGALLSKDLRPVMNEMKAAGQAVKAENDKAKAMGKPIYCVPKNTKMNSDDALKLFAGIPAERRKTMSVQQAWREGLIKRYPC
jgi:hypothetical protein